MIDNGYFLLAPFVGLQPCRALLLVECALGQYLFYRRFKLRRCKQTNTGCQTVEVGRTNTKAHTHTRVCVRVYGGV